jgi:Sulfotransferase family
MLTSNASNPDSRHAHLLAGVTFDPVFIVGDHRSGTTVLYQLLSLTDAFNVVTAYHVINYGEILDNHVNGRTVHARAALAEEFARRGLADRVIDGARVTPDLPEEYGFVIDASSSRPRLRPSTLPRLEELCAKLSVTGDARRPVLLKNPWDVLEFVQLKRAFPTARFIFIHRHPLDVMTSQLQATRSLLGAKNGYLALLSPWYRNVFERPVGLHLARLAATPRFGLGPRITARHVVKVTRYYLDHLASVPSADYVEIRYEDLCADPDATLARVLSFLALSRARPVAAREIVRARPRRIVPEVAGRYRAVAPALAEYCAAHGYQLLPDQILQDDGTGAARPDDR